jgi:hypothetical protein
VNNAASRLRGQDDDAVGRLNRRTTMKKNEVKVGGFYTAKVSDKLVTVRIDSTHSRTGWNATNTRPASASTSRALNACAAWPRAARAPRPAKHPRPPSPTTRGGRAESNGKAPTRKAKSKKANGNEKPKRVSALDAAAQVLKETNKPMRATELIEAMAERNLWKSPGGKTPHATLYAAMVREARDKGDASRFTKVDRGMFAFNG